jgi:hypothetical protein
MRKRLLLCGAALLVLFALSAMPSHASCAAGGFSNTPYLVFGPQAVSHSGLTQTATITFGTGCGVSDVITITDIEITGTNAGDFSVTGDGATPCNTETTLDIGPDEDASCTLGGTFTPTASGTRIATVTVSWSGSSPVGPGTPITFNLVGGDEIMYVTTGAGGQVLTVDGTTGAFEILSNGPTCTGTPPCFNPTGAVVGPDSKIYVTDQVNSEIWRMNQDGSQLEAVYQGSGCPDSAPCEVEGPSFSGSGTGDLYFNTYYNSGLYVLPDVATTAPGGPFQSPASVASAVSGGTGTAFDASGNLLAADVEFSAVWTISPPYTPSTEPPPQLINSSTTAVGTGSPAGIALNKLTGEMFVADPRGYVQQAEASVNQIMEVVPPVSPGTPATTTTYYAFSSPPACAETTDNVEYIQFDMTGHLFATTSSSPISFGDAGSTGCGRVWRIDPTSPPTATLLLDLNAVNTNGIPNVCSPFSCGLNSTQVIGLAVPPTQSAPQYFPLPANGGSVVAGYPATCIATLLPPNNCTITIGGTWPGGIFENPNDRLEVIFVEKTQADFKAEIAGTGYGGMGIMAAPVLGYGGNTIVPSTQCVNISTNLPCSDTVTPGTAYQMYATWASPQPDYCANPGGIMGGSIYFWQGEPASDVPYTSLNNVLVSCTDGQPGTKGTASCSSSSSSGCLSRWPNGYGPSVAPSVVASITVPPAPPAMAAVYTLNKDVTTAFTCGTSPAVVSCPGVVTQPDGTIVSVASGGPLPTSELGAYTLSVTPNVNAGTSMPASASYTVVGLEMPAIVNFGTLYLGQLAAQFVTVTNNGSSPTMISNTNITGPGNAVSDYIAAISLCPPTLVAGNSCSILVVALPTVKIFGPTASTATLNVGDSLGTQSAQLTAQVIDPRATLSAYSLNFGSQKETTTSAPETVTLTNSGLTQLNLSGLTISGNFAFAAGTTCTSGTVLLPGARCVISVSFTPESKGLLTGIVTITDNALISEQVIALSGKGD